ncbi:MAG: response regulator transcription factor [Candidatus Neomarinimicrobiota bacterium]
MTTTAISRTRRSKPKTTILVVEDHPILRDGLVQVINQQNDLEVICCADNAQVALALVRDKHPQAAIIDISLKGSNGIELIRDIKSMYDPIPILVLSMHDESLFAERAIRAGAKGYIRKSENTEQILAAIRQVIRGEYYVSSKMVSKVFGSLFDSRKDKARSPLEKLSDRELEVLQLIGEGNNTRRISELLFLSIKTIQTYQHRIKEKLFIDNATELIQYATQWVNEDT